MEQDCPPYLDTWRGVVEGTPVLLALLAEERVPATFFVTGEVARRFPETVRQILDAGHEVGAHGDTHVSFDTLSLSAARAEIARATATLGEFCTVTSFRAPYLRFPAACVPLLEEHGYRLDSSSARYKLPGARVHRLGGVLRVPASITSSTLRWHAWPRDWLLARLREPAVVFVHPWEFVDLRRERLRLDCRFKTGEPARCCLQESIAQLRRAAPRFLRLREYGDENDGVYRVRHE
jgi:peptidoglycan/xylan/chitin deacetylase (PgdA/CDA1 family)